MTVLVADIGGTNSRFGLFDVESNEMVDLESWPTESCSTLKKGVERFLQDKPIVPTAGCIAVAAPVFDGCATLTNSNWSGDVSQLSFPTKMLNDLEAAGYGVSVVPEADRLVLQKGQQKAGISLVVGLGTGFGQALLVGEDVYSTEAGHAEFSPFDALSLQFCQWLQHQQSRVRVEDVVSGLGMENLLRFTRLMHPEDVLPTGRPAGEIIGLHAETHLSCQLAHRLFLRSLGSVCADSILRTKASRLYLCGGVTSKMKEQIDSAEFWSVFSSKEPMQHLVDSTRLEIIDNEQLGLLGAARVAASL